MAQAMDLVAGIEEFGGVALAVEFQQVVHQQESADGDAITDAGVRPMPIVLMQPDGEFGFALC